MLSTLGAPTCVVQGFIHSTLEARHALSWHTAPWKPDVWGARFHTYCLGSPLVTHTHTHIHTHTQCCGSSIYVVCCRHASASASPVPCCTLSASKILSIICNRVMLGHAPPCPPHRPLRKRSTRRAASGQSSASRTRLAAPLLRLVARRPRPLPPGLRRRPRRRMMMTCTARHRLRP